MRVRLVKVPTGAAVRLDRPCTPAWQTVYDLQSASAVEDTGHNDAMVENVERYRKNCSVTEDSELYSRERYVVVVDGGWKQALAESDAALVAQGYECEISDEDFDAVPAADIAGYCSFGWARKTNLDNGHFFIYLWPDVRRRGLGTALLEWSVEYLRGKGRSVFLCYVPVLPVEEGDGPDAAGADGRACPAGPGGEFLNAHGFTVTYVEKHSGLWQLDDPQMRSKVRAVAQQQLAQSRPHWETDYELVFFTPQPPAELLGKVAEMFNHFDADMPRPEGIEPTPINPQTVQQWYRESRNKGFDSYMCVAVHRDSGQYVGFSEIEWSSGSGGAYQEGTWVHRDHRGKRLGIALKCANLEAILAGSDTRADDGAPTLARIHTENGSDNPHMLAINDTLGFEVKYYTGVWQRKDADG